MAGGKITRVALKGSKTDVDGDFNGFYKQLSMTAGDNNAFKAKVTNHGEPKEPEFKNGYFVKGWWSSDIEGNNKITEAIVDDTVYFHIETRNIPNGKPIGTTLYDDDVKRATEEKDSSDGSDKIKLGRKNSNDFRFLNYREVQNNKVVIPIILGGLLAKMIAEEEDKKVELFFACSYEGQNTELPIAFADYLKVKGMPKIIIVNGQWNIAATVPFGSNFGPIEPKKPYWVDKFSTAAKDYLDSEFKINEKYSIGGLELDVDELEKRNFILYYDGSSNYAGDQSGGDRFENGSIFAHENFEEITKGLGGQEVYFVSHSEGGAYAAGMAEYLFSRGIKIGEHVLLSPDEGNEFSINPEIPSYQLLYMFFSSIYNPIGTDIKLVKFKRWGSYYAIVDYIVNEHKIQGITKMGIVHNQDAGWEGVHGFTNGDDVFFKVSDLKDVTTFNTIGEYDNKVYSGKQQSEVTYKTKFYRIDDEYIIFNCPPIIKI